MKKIKSIVAIMLTCVTIIGMVGSVSGFTYGDYFFRNITIRHGDTVNPYIASGTPSTVSETRDFPLALKKTAIGRAGDCEIGLKKVVGSSYYDVGAYEKITVEYSDTYPYYHVYPNVIAGTRYLPYLSPSNGLILDIEYVKFYYN